MKRTEKQLRFCLETGTEVAKSIYRRAKHDHRLTYEQVEQLREVERMCRNAHVNLNQLKMRKWGK